MIVPIQPKPCGTEPGLRYIGYPFSASSASNYDIGIDSPSRAPDNFWTRYDPRLGFRDPPAAPDCADILAVNRQGMKLILTLVGLILLLIVHLGGLV